MTALVFGGELPAEHLRLHALTDTDIGGYCSPIYNIHISLSASIAVSRFLTFLSLYQQSPAS